MARAPSRRGKVAVFRRPRAGAQLRKGVGVSESAHHDARERGRWQLHARVVVPVSAGDRKPREFAAESAAREERPRATLHESGSAPDEPIGGVATRPAILHDFCLPVDDAPDLVFSGELIARVTSSPVPRADNFSRHAGRWIELALYRTDAGTYVCHETRRSVRAGERARCDRAETVGTGGAVVAFFKQTALAKRLYAEAGIEKRRRLP